MTIKQSRYDEAKPVAADSTLYNYSGNSPNGKSLASAEAAVAAYFEANRTVLV